MKDTARAAAALGVTRVTGFTGSPIWHLLYSFPPNDFGEIERGYEEFAERLGPILDVFDAEGVRFALEVHPTEIAYDFVTTRKALEAIGRPARLRNQPRPEPLRPASSWTRLRSSIEFADRIYHVHIKDSKRAARRAPLDPRLAPELRRGATAAGTSSRPATAMSTSRRCSARSTAIGYDGPLSIEWEDAGMDREWGARDALAFVRRIDFAPSTVAFDEAMQRGIEPRSASSRWGGRRPRCPGDRRRHARLRIHGHRRTRTRYQHARLHDLAAAADAAAGRDRRPQRRARSREAAAGYGFARAGRPTGDELVGDAASRAVRQRRAERPPRRADDRRGARPASTSSARSRSAAPRMRPTRSGSASRATGVKHMCAFNYRFVPAVRLAREMIEAGELGEIHHFRGRYLQEWVHRSAARATWRLDSDAGRLGRARRPRRARDRPRPLPRRRDQRRSQRSAAHVRRRARRARGRRRRVRGRGRVRGRRRRHDRGHAVRARPQERSRLGDQRQSSGSIAFDLERLNELQISTGDRPGSRRVLVTEANDPFWSHWWPRAT